MTDLVQLVVLGAIWGASFLFLRVSVHDIGPIPLVTIRLALGSLMLLPFLWQHREKFTLRRLPIMTLIGAVNSGLPFLLFAWATERAPAGIGAIANGLTALCAALVGFLFFHERLTRWQTIALFMGFLGIVVLASGKSDGASVGLATLAGALGSVLYGLGVNLARRHLQGLPAGALASVTLGTSALLTLPFSLATWPDHPVAMQSWLSAAALGLLCTGFAFVFYYRLIERIGPVRTSTVTYLIPPFGVAWAWIFLGEAATPTMIIACVLILGSVALSQRVTAPAAAK